MPDAHSCINRHIYLAGPHTYRWYLVEDSTNYGERDITLVTGWYQWSDCLSYAGLYMYDHVSSLNPDSTGYKTAYLECLEAQRHDSGSTTAYWGSTLIP